MKPDPTLTGSSELLRPSISIRELPALSERDESKRSFIIDISVENHSSPQRNRGRPSTNEAWRWILSRLIRPSWERTGSTTSEVSGTRVIGSTTNYSK